MPLYFATTNENKLRETSQILGFPVIGSPLEIAEIQSLDPIKVAVHKAQSYFKKLKKPLIIEDGSLFFSALNGLPGTYISDFSKALGNQGLCDLLKNHHDKSATAQVTYVYIDSSGHEIFIGELKGHITKQPLGENGFSWDQIFVPNGFNQTLAEMTSQEKNRISMRRIALTKLKKFLKSKQT